MEQLLLGMSLELDPESALKEEEDPLAETCWLCRVKPDGLLARELAALCSAELERYLNEVRVHACFTKLEELISICHQLL